jgi:hypothetical protein
MTGLNRPGKWKGGRKVIRDSLIDLILEAIVGALWGYESHAKNRYGGK